MRSKTLETSKKNIKKSGFGVFIEHKNNWGHEGGCLAQCDTRDQCSYWDGRVF